MHSPYELPAVGRPKPTAPLPKVAIEEHFNVLTAPSGSPGASGGAATDVDIDRLVKAMDYDRTWMARVEERLNEIGEMRLAEMDAAGVEWSLLSHTVPAVQGIIDRAEAVAAARRVNDHLAEAVTCHPNRLAGLGAVALQDPREAARELERCMHSLGFKGVMVNGYTNTADGRGLYLDEPSCQPFWEAAADLRAPVYIHPRPPIDERAYAGHAQLLGATWGFAPETATHVLRIVHSGLLDRLPGLTIILGHLGETLPYFAWRIQHCFEFNPSDKRLERRLQDYLCDNFYVSTSGHFSDQALISAILTIGADRILFAVDYPYEPMTPATQWIERAPISESDRRKIAHGNARRLFGLPPA
jgi:predicted TIM-barrel fold metal-dependent hydrolase